LSFQRPQSPSNGFCNLAQLIDAWRRRFILASHYFPELRQTSPVGVGWFLGSALQRGTISDATLKLVE
jgi:hypothetical protein